MGEEVWRYHRGSWTSMESPIEFVDEEGELLEAPAGYSPNTRWFGEESEFEIEVYSADPDAEVEAPSPYLVIFYNVADNIERVFVEDFPSLLQLLRETAPILDLPTRGWESENEFDEEDSEE